MGCAHDSRARRRRDLRALSAHLLAPSPAVQARRGHSGREGEERESLRVGDRDGAHVERQGSCRRSNSTDARADKPRLGCWQGREMRREARFGRGERFSHAIVINNITTFTALRSAASVAALSAPPRLHTLFTDEEVRQKLRLPIWL